MKNRLLIIILFILLIAACTPPAATTPPFTTEETIAPPTEISTDVPIQPPPTEVIQVADTSTPRQEGRTITVNSTSDSGLGTLRQALLDAQPYDTILFDPAIFPPDAPETIWVTSEPLVLHQNFVSVDASNAGVILDGSDLPRDSWDPGLDIHSDGNVVMGLQVINFTGTGIVVAMHGKDNIIGGDRSIGAGPVGQGNLSSGNGIGIGLWDHAANNTVTGNLIGTDLDGESSFGNRGSGIWVTEVGEENQVGPGNIIAFNRGCGIQVEGAGSSGNTLSQNSIHDNDGSGICLDYGGNDEQVPPLITNLDTNSGEVFGSTCPNCTVDIFSDESDEGEFLEGSTVADNQGRFAFSKGAPLQYPNLTTTVTYPDGSTSEFSPPMPAAYGNLSIQAGNNLPLIKTSLLPSQELLDNHTGAWFEDYGRYYDTAFVYRNGFKRIRIGALAGRDELGYPILSLQSIPPEVDATITEYVNNDVEIVLSLGMGSGLRPYGTSFESQAEIAQYIEFVEMVVSQFKGRIPYYEIWNEPGEIPLDNYINLIQEVVPIIHDDDPNAKIIIGAYAGPWDYGYPGYGKYQRFSLNVDKVYDLIRSGVISLVDGISWHSMYDNIASDPYYQDYPNMITGIKSLAESRGFSGEYFVDEVLFATYYEQGTDGGPPRNTTIAAKYYTRAIAEHRGLGVELTINTFFQEGGLAPIQNTNNALAGAEPIEMKVAVESEIPNLRVYTFSLPENDRLIAIWDNGDPAEFDPGNGVTLTISGLLTTGVVGIDVFYGFEQELFTETVDGQLVIRDLLVKDYPILIQLTDVTSP